MQPALNFGPLLTFNLQLSTFDVTAANPVAQRICSMDGSPAGMLKGRPDAEST
jgi:hypothetical protein